jgi:hypothetical protein
MTVGMRRKVGLRMDIPACSDIRQRPSAAATVVPSANRAMTCGFRPQHRHHCRRGLLEFKPLPQPPAFAH